MTPKTTVATVATWLGLSTRRVKELRAEKILPGAPGDDYDLQECVLAYCSHMRPASGRAASGGSDAAPDLDAARIRLLTAQAEAREMLNSQMRAETLTFGDMVVVAGGIVDAARAKSLALPTRAAPLLVGLANMAEIRDILTGLVHETLTELAAGDIIAKVTDRARTRAGLGIEPDPSPLGTAA